MKKRALMLKFAQDLRASYWFIPAAMVVAAILLAEVSQWLDRNVGVLPFQLAEGLLDTQVAGARSTLSTIATSVIGVTGVMFSMTIVAVSFAAGNYGPRLIGNFMRDRGNQVSLGILIATFAYTLIILRAVQDPSESAGVEAFVPQYSMLLALVGGMLAVFTMIYFVHHVPETINVSNITAKLGRALEVEVQNLIEAEACLDGDKTADLPDRAPDHEVNLPTAGYIQTLNFNRIEELADDWGWRIRVEKTPGDFVTPFTPVLSVWADDDLAPDGPALLGDCFAMGVSPTEHQNVLFIVDQLVEMLARALSPGVNDPFTAINCLNWMHNALRRARNHEGGFPKAGVSKHHYQPKLTYEALFARSFEAASPYCETDHLVVGQYEKLVENLKNPATC